jgi:hypothetical protein
MMKAPHLCAKFATVECFHLHLRVAPSLVYEPRAVVRPYAHSIRPQAIDADHKQIGHR